MKEIERFNTYDMKNYFIAELRHLDFVKMTAKSPMEAVEEYIKRYELNKSPMLAKNASDSDLIVVGFGDEGLKDDMYIRLRGDYGQLGKENDTQ